MRKIKCMVPAVLLAVAGWLMTDAAVFAETPTPTATPHQWPMYMHDSRNSGLSEYNGPTAGKLLWSYRLSSSITASGKFRWSYAPNGRFSPSFDADGNVYGYTSKGVDNFWIYTLSSNGIFRWSYETADTNRPITLAHDGTVYVGSNDWNIYSLTSSGALSWSYRTDESVCPGSIDNRGRLYIGSDDKRLYVFADPPTPTVTPTPTPTYAHTPMTIASGGGTANIPAPVATATTGWRYELVGCGDGEVFASVYDSENISTPGPGTGPQHLKINVYRVDEGLHVPAGSTITYMDGAELKTFYLPLLSSP